jgi:hypothetical protein
MEGFDIHHAIESVITGFIALIAWIGNRTISKVDKLVDQKADKDEVAALSRQLDAKTGEIVGRMDSTRVEMTARLDRIMDTLLARHT